MKKLCFIISFVVMLNLITFDMVSAAEHPYQISLANPLQLINERDSIKGIRINIVYGVNNNVTGFDFGLFNVAEGDQKGLQFGIYNSSFKTKGLQIGIINRTEYLNGIQIGLINIHAEAYTFRILPGINFSF